MADWKPHLNYNNNPSYHAYAYGLLYQNGFDPHFGGDGMMTQAMADFAAPTPTYPVALAGNAMQASPPDSPEELADGAHYRYQSSEFNYFKGNTDEQVVFSTLGQVPVDQQPHEAKQTGSDTASDCEAYISPGSWSSGSSREGGQIQADCMVWARNNQDENSSRSPGTNSCGSPAQNLRSYTVLGHEANYVHNGMAPAHMEAQTPKTPTTNTPKSKARTNFSDSQMNILSERFSMQRYLSPSEMRSMAELTGLTYKQVKTWFQNRRMKLRREQKSIGTGWTPECGTPLNHPLHIPAAAPNNYYRGEAGAQLKEHYTQQVVEAALKNPTSQNLAIYLASVAPNSGSAGYQPSWPKIPGIPQPSGVWQVPPGVGHYDYNAGPYNVAAGPPAEMVRQDGRIESMDNRCPPNTARLGDVGLARPTCPNERHSFPQYCM